MSPKKSIRRVIDYHISTSLIPNIDLLLNMALIPFLSAPPTKVGISFRGGGLYTTAYLGVLKYFEDNNIPIFYIIGSSGGALVGGLYSSGKTIEYISEIFKENFKILKLSSIKSITEMNIFDSNKLIKQIKDSVGNIKIEDLTINFAVQLTELKRNKNIIAESGDLAEIITASSAFNLLMDPVKIYGENYIDGDYSSGYASSFLREKGCDIVIGCDVVYPEIDNSNIENRLTGIIGKFKKTILDYDKQLDPVDLELKINTTDIGGILDGDMIDDFIERGYAEAGLASGSFKRVLDLEQEYDRKIKRTKK